MNRASVLLTCIAVPALLLGGCGGSLQQTAPVIPQDAQHAAAAESQASADVEQPLVVSADEPQRAAVALTATWRHTWVFGTAAPVPPSLEPLINHNGPWGPVYYHHGPTIAKAQNYAVYVNCDAACFGQPQFFFKRLATSKFAHVLDQYTGTTAPDRYTYGGAVDVKYLNSGQLSDRDINAIVHAVALVYGTGFRKIYHLFLTAKQARQSEYCAYHAWNRYSDIGETIYSIEPYQLSVPGCEPYNHLHSLPNGLLEDSTDNTLSHETFEAISDPSGRGWYSRKIGEIGDICQYTDDYVELSGQRFELQPESSNQERACVY